MNPATTISVHQKLRSVRDETGEPFNNILVKYGLERLLYRLDLSGNISLKAYQPATVVAEKLNALVVLGYRNSRMKDFYDLYILLKHMDFSDEELSLAIKATFERRKIALPKNVPIAFTPEFIEDGTKNFQWQAFIKRNPLEPELQLPDVLKYIKKRLLHILVTT